MQQAWTLYLVYFHNTNILITFLRFKENAEISQNKKKQDPSSKDYETIRKLVKGTDKPMKKIKWQA